MRLSSFNISQIKIFLTGQGDVLVYSLDFNINTCSFGNLNWALLCLVAKLEQQGTNEPQLHGEVE